MNGYDLATGQLLSGPAGLKSDGSTSCGNWLWCGSHTESGNMIARRNNTDSSGIGLYSQWGWAWPVNRRIMYNLASVDLNGTPWDVDDTVLFWDPAAAKWTGDVADGSASPISSGGGYPFVMKADLPAGRARFFGKGKVDGPFPEYYEPWESPVSNAMSSQQRNPLVKNFEKDSSGASMSPGDPGVYPIVGTTHHTVDHFNGGAVTRRIPLLNELNSEVQVEISEELAQERQIENGDTILVETARASLRAKALVTKRLKPLQANGETVHHISVPWSWGSRGLCTGDSGNLLTPRVGDPNTAVPEFRAFLCEVRKA
jgi:formate dehydrogenase major subunit